MDPAGVLRHPVKLIANKAVAAIRAAYFFIQILLSNFYFDQVMKRYDGFSKPIKA